jgi:MoaA/NifB/PqqE/SkfB family radical SAM enzyme
MTIAPSRIAIEASSFCQLRCPSCPTTSGATEAVIGGGFLKLSDFCKLLDDNPSVTEVELSNYGEMFFNPALPEILAAAFSRGVATIAANGANLNSARPGALEAIVRYQLRTLTCSIDGATEESYRRYRQRGSLSRVISNIREINRWKAQLNSPYPSLVWQFVIFGHNEREIAVARQMARELSMSFRAKLSWDPRFSPVRDEDLVRRESGVDAASRAEYKEKTGIDLMEGTCRQLWGRPQINWDGKLLGCCRNFWGDFGGNAFTDGLSACLDGEKMRYARDMLRGRQPPRDDIPCATCEIYQHNRAHGRWLNVDDAAE